MGIVLASLVCFGLAASLVEIWWRRGIAHQNIDCVERGDLSESANAELRSVGDDDGAPRACDHLRQHRSFFQKGRGQAVLRGQATYPMIAVSTLMFPDLNPTKPTVEAKFMQ